MDEFVYDPGADDESGLEPRMCCSQVILEEEEVVTPEPRERGDDSHDHQDDVGEFYDHITGVKLDGAGVRAAREEEVAYMRRME
eukprot:4921105-Amphidinium_carterae.1